MASSYNFSETDASDSEEELIKLQEACIDIPDG